MSAAKVPTVAPIYDSPCSEKLMATALSVNCRKLFKRVLLASAYPTTSKHVEDSHKDWTALGFEKRYMFPSPEERYQDTFLEKEDQLSEWRKSIDATSIVSALADLPWSEEHAQLMPRFSDQGAASVRRRVRNKLVGAYAATFIRDIIASSDLLITGSRGVTMLTDRSLKILEHRRVMATSSVVQAKRAFEIATGLGLAGLQSQVDRVANTSAEWFKKNVKFLEYMDEVSRASDHVSTNQHLFDRLPLKTWDPIGEVKGRSFSERVAIACSSDAQLERTFFMFKELSWKSKFLYDDVALKKILAAESIHAYNGMLFVRFNSVAGTTLPSASRKRGSSSKETQSANQSVLVVIDSDQLVDFFNILGGIGCVKMISSEFSNHWNILNQTYGAAIDEAMALVLESWKTKDEFFNIASAMKTSYTASMLGSYEEVSNYPGMQLLIGPTKSKIISSLSGFSKQRSKEVLEQAEIKAPKFMAKLKVILAKVSEYRAMEILSLLPLLPTTERYLSDVFERIHNMGDKERPQSQAQIVSFIRKYESTIAEWAIRAHGDLRNVECDQQIKELIEKELRTERTTTLASGVTHVLPFELPEAAVGKVRYVRRGSRTMWGRFWHLLAKPVSDFPSEDDGSMGPETLAALKNGRYIYGGMTYLEVIRNVSKLGLGYKLFTAIKMENTKKTSNTRMTANPQRVPKWIVSDLEREVRSEGYRVPAMTQCRGEANRSDSWHQTGEQVRSEEPWLVTYQDCEAWSEGQNRKRTIERDFAAIKEMAFPDMFSKAWRELWSSPVLTTTRKRISTSAPWDHSLMQGIRGCGDSVEHAVILAEFKDLVAKRLGSEFAQIFKGQTNIDDVYSELLAKVPWDVVSVTKVWQILKEQYANHGYLLDSSKSGLSAHKVTYLGLSSVFGLDLPSGLKTLSKSGFIHPFASPTVEEYVERLKGYLRSSYNNLLPILSVYNIFTALACVRISREISSKESVGENDETRALAIALSMKVSSDLGGFGWPSLVQVNLQDSCSTSETAISSIYASLFTPGLPQSLYNLSMKAYACICKYALSLKMTKRSGFEALRNSYSVRPRIPASAKVEIEKFARHKATENIDSRNLNCGSLLGKQHSRNFEEGLEMLLSRMQLDAGTARALANAMPESARLAMMDKYVSGLAASGQRTPEYRRVMELMKKSDLNRLNHVQGSLEKVIKEVSAEGSHLLSSISPMKPTEVSAKIFALQAAADGYVFQNQTLGHPYSTVLNTTSLSVKHHIEIKGTADLTVDILNESYPGLYGSKRSSRRVESSTSGAAALFSSLFHVEPFGKDVISSLVSIADERAHGFCHDILLYILWVSWGGHLNIEPFNKIPEIAASSSKRAIGSCAVTMHETLALRNIWHLFETRAPKGNFLLERTPNLLDPAALRFYLLAG